MPTYQCRRSALGGFLLLTSIACGPPRPDLVADAETGEGGEPGTEGTEVGEEPGTTTGAEPSTSMGDAEFTPEPDMPAVDCDPWTQDCPDGEKCVPYASGGGSWDANKCVAVMGAQAVGEPCTYAGAVEATDDCDETSICWNATEIDGELHGVCHALCPGFPDDPQCPESNQCLGSGAVWICIPTCHPLLQDCAEGEGCFWAAGSFTCVSTTQEIPAGEPCGFINDCAAGLFCLELPACEGSACCSPFCDLSLGDGQCEAFPGTSCLAFFGEDQPPPGYEQVGVCAAL